MNGKITTSKHASLSAARVAMVLACMIASIATASSDPTGHAPIGVMADHTHHKGETMLSYRYMRMGMNGLRDGDDRISRAQVLLDFPVTPIRMEMQMHMFGLMHSPIERLTLMLMVPFVRLEMDHRTGMGGAFTTRSDGIGDIRAAGLIDLWQQGGHKVHAKLGLSFPTGSIKKRDETPMSMSVAVRLPYPMQLGSGSFDFLPGLTYTGESNAWSWGAQTSGEIRLNENHADYRLGNEYALTAWGAREFTRWLSMSLRFEWQHILNIRGRDQSSSINPLVVPTADPDRRAVQRLDALIGFNFILPSGSLSGIRFAVEAGLPAYQRLDGPGLETDWITTVGVQYAF